MSRSRDGAPSAVGDQQAAGHTPPIVRALSIDEIVEVGLRVGLRDGFETLGMRNLSRELGVSAMALYHHVHNKRALLSVIVDSVLRKIEIPTEAEGDWEQRLRLLHRRDGEVLARYPGLDRVIWDLPPTAEGTRLMKGYLQILRDGGLDERDAAGVFGVIYCYGLGLATVQRFLPDHDSAEARAEGRPERGRSAGGGRHEPSWAALRRHGVDADLALDVITGGVRALVARGGRRTGD